MVPFLWMCAALAADPEAPPEVPLAAAPPADLRAEEAESTYRTALALSAAGKYDEACAALQRVTVEFPESTYAAAAKRQMTQIAPLVTGGACGGVAPVPAPRRDRSGNTDLIVSQTVLSTAWWSLVPAGSLRIDEPSLWLVGGLVGLGSGLGGTIAYTRKHDVTEGQVAALNFGEALGGWHGAAFVVVAQPGESPPYFLAPGLGVLGGGVVGALVASNVNPTAGQAALASHTAFWGAYAGSLSLLFAGDTSRYSVLVPLISGDAGMGLGIYLANRFPDTSRSHVRLISLGGGAGAVATLMVLGLVGIGGTELTPQSAGTAMFVGTGLGMGAAIALTRHMDDPDRQVRNDVFVTPMIPSLSRDPRGAWTVRGGLNGSF